MTAYLETLRAKQVDRVRTATEWAFQVMQRRPTFAPRPFEHHELGCRIHGCTAIASRPQGEFAHGDSCYCTRCVGVRAGRNEQYNRIVAERNAKSEAVAHVMAMPSCTEMLRETTENIQKLADVFMPRSLAEHEARVRTMQPVAEEEWDRLRSTAQVYANGEARPVHRYECGCGLLWTSIHDAEEHCYYAGDKS